MDNGKKYKSPRKRNDGQQRNNDFGFSKDRSDRPRRDDRPARSEGRFERPNRSERSERFEKPEGNWRGDRKPFGADRPRRDDRPGRFDRSDRPERSGFTKAPSDRSERFEKPEGNWRGDRKPFGRREDRPARGDDRPGRFDRFDKPERSDRFEKPETNWRGDRKPFSRREDRPERSEGRFERFDKPGRSERSERFERSEGNWRGDRKPFGRRDDKPRRSEGRFERSERSERGGERSERKSRGPKRSSEDDAAQSGGRSRQQGRAQRRADKKFDPSLFIKKVEEQIAQPVYVPKNMFADFPIEAQIKENIEHKGYTTPTPIQDAVIPILLEGKDVIATANTGTGKTAAFLIPLIHNIMTKKTTRALIVTPTRELADQINNELLDFKHKTGLYSTICIGGASMANQIRDLKKQPQFVVGTPGRLIDLERNGEINFVAYDAIVLDEVDTMLDMGFINDIKYISQRLPEKRHSLFFSATIPAAMNDLMKRFLTDPVSVSVKTRQSSSNVNQEVVKVTKENKLDVLHDLLIKPEFKRVIIFVRTKRAADKLARTLKERGFEVTSIHGDRTQGQRKAALALFKNGTVNILIATDVVARGIDIDDVTHVINFDLPQEHEDYIHRIGRTGRADKVGQAITFIE